MKRTIGGVCFALLLTLTSTAQAANNWLQVDTPHFTFISSDNEGRTRDIAIQFEQIRSVVATLWPWTRTDTDRPVTVLCVADDDGIKRLAPIDWKPQDAVRLTSIFEQAPERYYIGVRSDARAGEQVGINPYYNAYWSYVGLIIRSSVEARLPDWFISGIAGVMANTQVHANEVQVGRLHPDDLRELRQSTRIRLRQLIVADAASPAYAEPTRLRTFNAQATVLLHMLLYGGGEHNPRAGQVDAFLNRLRGGASPDAAFEQTFGSPDALENEFAQYFNRSILMFGRVPADLRVGKERFPARRLTAAEASTALAGYHVAIKRYDDAASEIRQAREADPAMASAFDVEGLLFDRTNERDKARASFEKAVEAGSTNFYTYYRLAQMLFGDASRATLTRREMLLERSVAANRTFPQAHAMLSDVKAQLGKASEAIELGRKAVQMEPNTFDTHYALAYALAAEHPADGIRELRQATLFATTDSQKQAAAELIKQITDAAIAHVPPLPKPSAPPADALRVGGEVKPPVRTKDARPVYPEVAAAAAIQGMVILEAIIGADGKVAQATVLRSIPLLDAAAIEAVRQWEYQPTVVNGVAVPLIYTVTVGFTLQ
jgi:TonB family protein